MPVKIPSSNPKPFLKWAGGKGQLLDSLLQGVQEAGDFFAYHEPFVGGGALFFGLYRTDKLKGPVYLSDSNTHLMEAWLGVRNELDAIIPLLAAHKEAHNETHYYAVRAETPGNLAERAARILYLNRTCFNGLFRLNSRGGFNVPMGRYVNPRICDETNLRACAAALQTASLEVRSFESVLDRANPGDFVYFDPPYHPLSKTSSFTAYDKNGFTEDDQCRLAAVFRELDARGARLLLSNSDTPFIRDLYKDFRIETVWAIRSVNSVAGKRGAVAEVLVRNR